MHSQQFHRTYGQRKEMKLIKWSLNNILILLEDVIIFMSKFNETKVLMFESLADFKNKYQSKQ